MRACVIDDHFLLQVLPLSRNEGPSSWTDALAVYPVLFGDIGIDLPCAAGPPHVAGGEASACIGAARRSVTAIQPRQLAPFGEIETRFKSDIVCQTPGEKRGGRRVNEPCTADWRYCRRRINRTLWILHFQNLCRAILLHRHILGAPDAICRQAI